MSITVLRAPRCGRPPFLIQPAPANDAGPVRTREWPGSSAIIFVAAIILLALGLAVSS